MTESTDSLKFHKFDIGEDNITHRKFGKCNITGLENWKGILFYKIRLYGSIVEFMVTESTLSKEIKQ